MPVIADRVSVSIDNILIATDFSFASRKAAAYAKALCQNGKPETMAGRLLTTRPVDICRVADDDSTQRVAAQIRFTSSADQSPVTLLAYLGHPPTRFGLEAT